MAVLSLSAWKSTLVVLALSVTFSACTAAAPAKKEEALEKVNVGYLVAPTMASLYVIKQAGFFEKNGLDVTPVITQGGPTAIAGMLAGDLKFTLLSGASFVESTLQGGDTIMFLGVLNVMNYELIGGKTIKTAADLKGQKVGILRLGDGTDFAARYAVSRLNLQPDKDVGIIATGDQNARFAALEAGAVQATVIQPPFTLKAKKMGYTSLVDLASIGPEYQQTAMAATKAFMTKNESTMRKMAKAWVEGIQFYKTNKEAAMKSIGEYLKTDSSEDMENAWAFYADKTPATPYISATGIKTILDEMSATLPKAKDARPEMFFENKYVKELDDSGFIKKLYGK